MSELQTVPLQDHATAGPEVAAPSFESREGSSAPVPAPGLMVGSANDPAEQQADKLAARALARLANSSPGATSNPSATQHQHGSGCDHVRRASTPSDTGSVGAEGGALDGGASSRIASMRGGGRALDAPLRAQMETAFGTGLGDVRIHDNAQAAALSQSMSAHAFTTGKDIFFGAGQFSPDTAMGKQVLAHELAHAVTEGGSPVRRGVFGRFKAFVKGEEYVPSAKEETNDLRTAEKESDEKARVEGIAGRTKLQQMIQDGSPLLMGETPAERSTELNNVMREALVREEKKIAQLKGDHQSTPGTWDSDWSEDRVADQVYQEIYVDGLDAELLQHVAPSRSNEVERLVRLVRQVRAAANTQVNSKEIGKGTKTAPKEINAFYDLVAKDIEAAISTEAAKVRPPVPGPRVPGSTTPTPPSAKEKQRVNAAKSEKRREVLETQTAALCLAVRNGATPELVAKLPGVDTALEKAYIAAALQRRQINGPDGPEAEELTLDGFTEKFDTYSGYAESGGGAVSMAAQGVGALIPDGPDKFSEGLKVNDGPGILSSLPGGEFISSTIAANDRVSKQKIAKKTGSGEDYSKDDNISEKIDSLDTRVTSGIGTSISILTTLKDAVSSFMKTISGIKEAIESKNPRKAFEILKSGSDGLSSLVEGAKGSAELAQKIDPSVKDAVGKVIPGFDITLATLAIVGNASELADAAVTMYDTNTAIQSARIRGLDGPKKKVDVMVYPLTKVSQSHTIQLEQKAWSTGKSISDLMTSIASLVTGGGFGIPKAVEAGVSLIDTLHNLGHRIAKEILTAAAKRTERESKLSLEGSASNVLESNPAMAVEGIIIQAALKKDAIAEAFLGNYRIEGAPITRTMLDKIQLPNPQSEGPSGDSTALFDMRDAVLASMGDDADPKQIWEAYKPIASKWSRLKEMGEQRTEMDKAAGGGKVKSRGYGWRLKMMLRSDDKMAQSSFKTQVNHQEFQGSQAQNAPAREASQRLMIVCGDQYLVEGSTETEIDEFSEKVMKMDVAVIERALKDRGNRDDAIEILTQILADRKAELATASGGSTP